MCSSDLDLVSFTWNIKTMEGRPAIREMLDACGSGVAACNWKVESAPTEANGLIEAWLTFDTKVGRGTGHLRLRDGKCWTLLTTLQELKGFEEQRGFTRPMGVQHGASKHRVTWQERRRREEAELGYSRQPYVVIIGGGQGGIGLGARLRQIGVPTIIIERSPRAGDAWRHRYDSLTLHDPVWFDHMPYIPFPEHWPIYTPKDQMGDWLEMYVKIMELNYWTSTECTGARYDEAAGRWDVTVERRIGDADEIRA